MKRSLNIFCIIILALAASSCSRGPRVIPRGKMARIYAEMLVTDQWINSTPSVKRMADTSLVYEPILEKYGYTTEDYRRSVEVYMDDPERYSRIFRSASKIIDDQIEDLKKLKIELSKPKFELRHYIDVGEYYPYIKSEPYLHFFDSVAVQLDSTLFYRLVSVERSDTLYDRLRMIVQSDSLTVTDSLTLSDSLSVSDLKPVSDSLSRPAHRNVPDTSATVDLTQKPKRLEIPRSPLHSKGKQEEVLQLNNKF